MLSVEKMRKTVGKSLWKSEVKICTVGGCFGIRTRFNVGKLRFSTIFEQVFYSILHSRFSIITDRRMGFPSFPHSLLLI